MAGRQLGMRPVGRTVAAHSGEHPSTRLTARWLAGLMAVLLLATACTTKERIVYVDDEHEPGAGQPIGASSDPRIHRDGTHHPAPDVAVGPADAHAEEPYVPIGQRGGALVKAGPSPQATPPVSLAHERAAGASSSTASSHGSSSTASSHTSSASPAASSGHAAPSASPVAARGPATGAGAPVSAARPGTGAPGAAAAARAGGPALAVASPTPPTRLALSTGLGAPVPTSGVGSALSIGDDDLAIVAGPVDSVDGQTVMVKTASGPARVQIGDRARVEREGRASQSDLKPGQFVGAVQPPGGPASVVRLYSQGPGMPQAGIVPMVGTRQGQVTTFGSIVALQFGGMLLNTGGETTSVTLPGTVEVLKPVPVPVSELRPGAQIVASGVMTGEGTLSASALRVTSEGPLAR